MPFSVNASISLGGRTRIAIPSQTDNKQLSVQNNRNPDTAHSFFSFPSSRMELNVCSRNTCYMRLEIWFTLGCDLKYFIACHFSKILTKNNKFMNYTGKTPQVIYKTILAVDYFKYQEFISQIVLFYYFFLKFSLICN